MPQIAQESQRCDYADPACRRISILGRDSICRIVVTGGNPMAVKDAILAILTLGSAYGLQLRDELAARAPHRAGVNVGQIYSTLDRLVRDGLIRSDTATDDNLPLYTLTPTGHAAASDWLGVPTAPDVRNWADMADQVLVASSLPGSGWRKVIAMQLDSWTASLADAVPSGDDSGSPALRVELARSADERIARAAIDWLGDVDARLTAAGDPSVPLRSTRPLRGRRPGPMLNDHA
ncbi:PadR family transcriptional regulator [Mycetocola zhujimingii]|nr:PadR family transcriptional regulator [Mycetocola zhujimingii]